ncbi:HhH-GPD family base excision DNA repair protein [Colletotrichum musicola]|uniref:HhH-GPD family base excision DNA repair protein n=1 Tax=Colletotrichum musicola TaxID=2175873 RepID=A0A8H6NXZ3_9PEZI|nr:HhH-GPD family base excision DNA repair protein [Colletotrichum musicola]
MPGRTPYPDHPSPTPEQCQEVHDILTELHGVFKSPDKIPPPSTEVAGCGEVPDLVDAMIRTLISGHTTMGNANKAIQDVITHYGQLDGNGIGAGSIDWNHVRRSPENEVVQTIRRAGLANTKGKKIKEILDMVYEDNQARKLAYVKEKETGEEAGAPGSAKLTQGQKDHQLLKIENGILTMDHVRGMTTNEAMLEFTKYPGIGVKTASCLVLFCLQQPSFAVDTHVWRMCKWLGWIPPKASRDDAYMHCELRVPGHLKYGLHQLFIQHGKSCGRCRTITVKGTADWTTATCPLEHLLDRFDKRQTKAQPKKISQKKAKVEISEDLADTEAEEKTIVPMADEEHETQVRERGFEEEDSDLSQDSTEDSRSMNETYEPEMMEYEANQNEEIVADSEKLRFSQEPSSIVAGSVQEQTEFRTQDVVELQQTLHKGEVEVAEPPADVTSRGARAARRPMLREQRESA